METNTDFNPKGLRKHYILLKGKIIERREPGFLAVDVKDNKFLKDELQVYFEPLSKDGNEIYMKENDNFIFLIFHEQDESKMDYILNKIKELLKD